jgi:predicted AlkP superfamily phosphohydrolase/phosphomutase
MRRPALLALLPLLLLLPACGGEEPPPRILVLGLDGATFDLLDPWLEAGDLPHLAALRDGGVSGDLLSVIPPLSPPAWSTAATGVNPGAHGVFDFFRLDPDSTVAYAVTGDSRRVPGVWSLFSDAGRRAGILNIPVTDPPDPIDGYAVAGFPHPDTTGWAHPPELEDRLRADGYQLDELNQVLRDGEERAFADHMLHGLRARRAAAETLLREYPDLDLHWIVFTATDRAQHFFWRFMEEEHPFHDPALAGEFGGFLHDLWVEVDDAVGSLVAIAREQAAADGRDLAVLVISDHGMAPVHRAFRPQSFLRHPPDGSEPITEAYSLENDASILYVPKHGRERNATLSEGEHDRMADEVVRRILAARDPEGGAAPALFGARSEDIYTGRYTALAPDIVFLWREPYYFVNEAGDKDPFGTPKFTFSAHHAPAGIVIAHGPMFRRGTVEGRQSLLDIAPTLLHLGGLPVAGYMEGAVLTPFLDPAWLEAHPVAVDGSEAREVGSDEEGMRAIPYLQ